MTGIRQRQLERVREALRGLQAIDAEMRRLSVCPTCGKPASGMLRVPVRGEKGTVTGRIYSGREVIRAEDAGLCGCGKPPRAVGMVEEEMAQ